jgi:hypothetical protein
MSSMFLGLPGLEGEDPTMLRMSTTVYKSTRNNIPACIESSCLLDVFAALLFVGTVDVCVLVVSLS